MQNKTFAIIKPDAIENKYTGKIIDRILSENFNIIEARLIKMNKNQAEEFYGIHKERPFFNDLVSYMCSGQSMVLWLEKDNAVDAYRELIGSTNPDNAEEGTIRKLFATSMQQNAVHGSDSDENANLEADFFFSKFDRH